MIKIKNIYRAYPTFLLLFMLVLMLALIGCSDGADKDSIEKEDKSNHIVKSLELDKVSGRIGDEVTITVEDLIPNEPLHVVWSEMDGAYLLEDNYAFIGAAYDPADEELLKDKADADGNWTGTITIPDGFGDDHDVMIYQDDALMAKANFFVETVFTMSPESGPIGTEITITGEGLSWKMYGSLWHLNYDNKYTGMITAVSTKGKATAVIRAAGNVGDHSIAIESGASGSPYLNRIGSSINYIETQYFAFSVTDEEPLIKESYVEDPPASAANQIVMPEVENESGVAIELNKESGNVDDAVTLTGTGLPADSKVTLNWHTMSGDRVSFDGFSEVVWDLGEAETDESGAFEFPFTIPEDLGGLPHLIDVVIDEKVYGQTYFKILPSIVSITPESGPPGTQFYVKIKGSGWTEFDNALAVTYDNASVGYVCGFNEQGTIMLPLIAAGDPGYHLVDIYPAIYKGQQIQPDLYIKPQLTYRDDHPGTNIPALRALFKVTEE